MNRWKLTALFAAILLVLAACGGTTEDTEAPGTEAPATEAPATEAPATTMAMMDFEGTTLDAGGCDYGGKVSSITALDEHTVEFALCGPDPAFLAKMAFSVFGIQPSEHLEATGGAPLDNPVGTGPWSLDSWNRGDSVVLARNDAYYGQLPAQATAVYRWATEGAQRLLELQSGNVDVITFPSPDDVPTIEGDASLVLLDKPEPNILYFGMNNTSPPFDNLMVRQAIAMGIDRQRIVDNFFPVGSVTASHFTPCTISGGCEGESWYDFDLDAAKQMLADAGFPDGFETTISYRDVFRGYLPEPPLVAVDLQNQLADLGITAEIVVMESGEYSAAFSAGALEGIYMFGWTGDYPHATNFLDYHFNENTPSWGVLDPSIYEPLKAASGLADVAATLPLYAEANNAIKELVPMIPVLHSTANYAALASVAGAYAPPWGDTSLNLLDSGKDTIVFMQNAEPISLYCADESDGESLRVCAQIIEGLYSYGPDGAIQPQLATSCDANADLTVWTCHLREGVVFHDGSHFDANDVVATFAAGLDAANPLHVGNTGTFDYYAYLWDGLINAEG